MFTIGRYGLLIASWFLFSNFDYKEANMAAIKLNQKCNDTIFLYFPLPDLVSNANNTTNSLDTFMNVWYSRMLSAMKEPILTDYEGDAEIYRFTWLRSFHRPIMIRVEKSNNSIKLTAKELNGRGGYQPGKLSNVITLRISEYQWNLGVSMIKDLNFWNLGMDADARGFDGAEWIIEGSTRENYHFTTAWSPGKTGNYGKYCLFLLNLSGIKVPQKEIY